MKGLASFFVLAATSSIVAGVSEHCRGYPVLNGDGTLIDVSKEQFGKIGYTIYDAHDDALVLARGEDSQGLAKLDTNIRDKVGYGHHDVGMQFGFKITSEGLASSGYGLIWSFGGNRECVEDRIASLDGMLFHGSARFCKGVYLAVWADSPTHKGVYLVVDGYVVQSFENIEPFDQWHCLTLRINGDPGTPAYPKGTAEFHLDEYVLGHSQNWQEASLEGDGKEVFVYGKTAKNKADTRVQIQDVQIKTKRDTTHIHFLKNMEIDAQITVSYIFWGAGFALLSTVVYVLVEKRRKRVTLIAANALERDLLVAAN
eukprot:CAMPEP_0113943152 /NCGR_PEP_ID=MMETSP1339-20121228/19213_1 /TAXON_ID=94617 /ORGANISM="Fibrocapsa japonica" /LENGTH=313 /DNA_ID=CAMNT_0000947941 /DNA_START=113 /DNA_END=1054 /DNA_ORIENTATION=- /assembly_acc=CAM_ASM_000762